ncbi:hypothetical protein nbrc107696_08060 [Gordonia spumicola]|uniref:C-methyltransferase domain-containing protein n=1 Tax=Gordonia spumicola TaxID=589161 RepID=A0A7I9V5M6_9ACTN|nr:hypothetical protein nbrc107696_08060 [Gordonia spumicola]
MQRVVDLGAVPAGDDFPLAASSACDDARHPLTVSLCSACGLVQLDDAGPAPEEPRGVEPRALRDQAAAALDLAAAAGLLAGETVIEFPSPHGGTWLDLAAARGLRRADPPASADVVVDSLGIMHDADQRAAFAARAAATAPDGTLLLQFHSVATIIRDRQWNAFRHGHFAYYSLTAVCALLDAAGMHVSHVWEFDLYGGTVLVAARHGRMSTQIPQVRRMIAAEAAVGVTDPRVLRGLSEAATAQTRALAEWAHRLSRAGASVYAYAASSRAVALLAGSGLTSSTLRGVIDASPAKLGRRMPGTDIPIVSVDALALADVVYLTVPDLRDEVLESYPRLAGRLVVRPEGPAGPATWPKSRHRSLAMQSRLHHAVPGGAHTYARGPDQYPEGMAPILSHGLRAHVWDVDGNEYIEYGVGLRSVTLGHACPPVVDAVARELGRGANFSRPTELELLAAEDFLSTVPTADMVKFAKNGSDTTTAAVRLARAVTGRDMVAICDQPFFSVDDWFIGATAMPAGVPRPAVEATVRFRYNSLDSLDAQFAANPGRIACVFMEAATAQAEPEPGFLEGVRRLCDENGALLVFDEIITGFRWSPHGAQHTYGVVPDLSCWGKAMGNGHPIAALAGRREFMERGGLRTDDDRVFLLSTTHGPETSSLAAFRAVVAEYRTGDPVAAMESAGARLIDGVNRVVADAGLSDFVAASGRSSCAVFSTFGPDGQPSQEFRTLFLQEMIDRGVLGQSFVISAAHTEADVDATVDAVAAALPGYRAAIEKGSVDGVLRGRPVAPAIRGRAHPRRV